MVAGRERTRTAFDAVTVVFDDGTGQLFDRAVHGSLKDGANLACVVKENGTVDGKPIVALTFRVQLPDGSVARAQTVTTARALIAAAKLIAARYDLA